jgi:6-hydroxycyclohex-1-ene-1-carbonyl-CoA dehydrogenase
MNHRAEPVGELGIAIVAAQPNGAAVGIVDDADERSAALLGKRVLVPAVEPCGQCDVCRRGGAAVCPYLRRHEPAASRRRRASGRWLVTLGDGLDLPTPAAAAVAGDVAIAYTLYARTGLSPREPAVVIGATAIARFLVEILIAKSITPTVVVDDPDDQAWCAWLAAKGAVLARGGGDLRAMIAGGVATQGLGARPWRLFAADPRELARAAAVSGPRATLTALAPAAPVALPASLLALEVTVIGVAGPHPDLVVEAAALCARGEVDLVGGVTADPADGTRAHVISFD